MFADVPEEIERYFDWTNLDQDTWQWTIRSKTRLMEASSSSVTSEISDLTPRWVTMTDHRIVRGRDPVVGDRILAFTDDADVVVITVEVMPSGGIMRSLEANHFVADLERPRRRPSLITYHRHDPCRAPIVWPKSMAGRRSRAL